MSVAVSQVRSFNGKKAWAQRAIHALPFALTIGVFYRVAVLGEVFALRDTQRVYYPLKAYWAARVRRGEWPSWYPGDALGQPYVGMVISGAFHPLNALYLLCSPPVAFAICVLVCYPLAAYGVFAFARARGGSPTSAMFAGLFYAFSGYLISISNNFDYLLAAATLPWVLVCAERCLARPSVARSAIAGVILASMIFAGDPLAWAMSCAAVALLGAIGGRPRLPWAAVIVAWSLPISAAVLLPAAAILPHTAFPGFTFDQVTTWSTHPVRLLELILGPLFASEAMPTERAPALVASRLLHQGHHALWVGSLAVGPVVCALAVVALWRNWRRRDAQAACVAVLATALVALGRFTPVYGLLYRVTPPFRSFRYPEKALPLLFVVIALASAAGLDALADPVIRKRFAGVLLGIAAVAGVVACVAGLTSLPAGWVAQHLSASDVRETSAYLSRLWSRAGERTALFALLGWAVVRMAPAGRVAVGAGGVGIAFLILAAPPFYSTAPHDAVERFGLLPDPNKGRLYSLDASDLIPDVPGLRSEAVQANGLAESMAADAAAVTGVRYANVELPAASARVSLLHDDERSYVDRVSPLLGTVYVVAADRNLRSLAEAGYRPVARVEAFGVSLLEHPGARPRVYVARPECVGSTDEAHRRIRSTALLGGSGAVVEKTGECAGDGAGEATLTELSPEHLDVSVTSPRGTLLVDNDAFYRGWRATLDGRPAEIWPTNVAVRGVFVPPGSHRVELTFEAPLARTGVLISGAALALVALLVAAERFRGEGRARA